MRTRGDLMIENLALRQPLAVFARGGRTRRPVRMARATDSSGSRSAVASSGISCLLDMALAERATVSRGSATHREGGSRARATHGDRERTVGRAADPWRAPDARLLCLGAYGLA